MARGGMRGLPQDQVTGSVARFVADAVMNDVEPDVGLIGTAPPTAVPGRRHRAKHLPAPVVRRYDARRIGTPGARGLGGIVGLGGVAWVFGGRARGQPAAPAPKRGVPDRAGAVLSGVRCLALRGGHTLGPSGPVSVRTRVLHAPS